MCHIIGEVHEHLSFFIVPNWSMQDLYYIIYNTLVYGLFAYVVMSFLAYNKYINFALWNFMIIGAFLIYSRYHHGFQWQTLVFLIVVLIVYLATNTLLIKHFKNVRKRDLVWIVFTFGLSTVLLNLTNMVYGPNSINIETPISLGWLLGLLILINILIVYFQKTTIYGTILTWMFENEKTLQSLGIPVKKIRFVLSWFFLVLLFICWYLILAGSNMRSSDSLFYFIKWLWIMILVGVSKSELVFVVAFLYVVLEYMLFIRRWLPIAYKETLMLIVILGMLLFRPQGLFTARKRKI